MGGGFGGGHMGGGFGGFSGGRGGFGGYSGGHIGGYSGGMRSGSVPSIGSSRGAASIGGAGRNTANSFTSRHVGGTVTQGYRGVNGTNALRSTGTHAQSLVNHRTGLSAPNNAQFLHNHQVATGTAGTATMGTAARNLATARSVGGWNHGSNWNGAAWRNHMGHHHGFNRNFFFFPFFGFGYPFFGFGFWPYYGYGYGGYGYGYGYGYPYYSYGMYGNALPYDVAQATDDTAQPGSKSDAQVLADQGEADFKKGDYKAAAYSWRHAAVDDPKNGVILMMLSQALFATGKYDEAAGAAQQAMQFLPEDEWGVVITNYKELYGKTGDYTTQLRALEKSVKDKGDDPATRFLLGFHYAYLGYPSHAVKQLDKALELAPQDELAKKVRELMAAKLPKQ
jgi:hypothetical protein